MKIVHNGSSFNLGYEQLLENDLIVRANTFVNIYGIVTGNIEMQEYARVTIMGEVKGMIYNNGGKLYIDGIVGGVIENGGVMTLTNTAIIRNRIK